MFVWVASQTAWWRDPTDARWTVSLRICDRAGRRSRSRAGCGQLAVGTRRIATVTRASELANCKRRQIVRVLLIALLLLRPPVSVVQAMSAGRRSRAGCGQLATGTRRIATVCCREVQKRRQIVRVLLIVLLLRPPASCCVVENMSVVDANGIMPKDGRTAFQPRRGTGGESRKHQAACWMNPPAK